VAVPKLLYGRKDNKVVKFTAHNSPMVCAAQIWSTKLHHWANRWDAIVCEPCREAAQVHELEAMKSHVELAAGHLLQALKCAAKLAESQPTAPNTARQEILLCAWRSLCGYQEDIRCISTGSCNWQRKTSAVA